MSDKKILEALQICAAGCSKKCSYYEFDIEKCKSDLMDDALNLLNRQQADIERLKAILKINDEIIAEFEEQNELEIADGGASCHLCIKVHTDRAIKEFAEKLKAKAKSFLAADILGTDDIDELVEEMVGADSES